MLAREDEPGDKRLVAYVVPSAQAWQDVEDLRAYLRQRLPDYMVPGVFVPLDALPLTPNGKLDRRALPAPDADAADSSAVYVAPRNPVEEAVCEVWQEVLRRERVGIEDNFFSLGGDSILSIRVVSLLKNRGIALNIKDIFQHQTVAQLAAHAQQGTVAAEPLQLEPFALLTDEERASLVGDYEDAYPMSALQAGMVFHTQLDQFSGVYHDIMAEHVRCVWDEEVLRVGAVGLRARAPAVAHGFLLDRERPLQVVHKSIELPLEVEDLRHLSAEEQEVYLSEWTEKRKRHVFDWERGPLFSVHVFRRSDDSFQYVISFHHAVLDGWSKAVFTTELYNRYERLLSGRESEAAEAEWTYRDFIAQEQRVVADPEAKQYFAEMLEDAPAQQLPRLKTAGGGERSQGRFAVDGFALLSSRLCRVKPCAGRAGAGCAARRSLQSAGEHERAAARRQLRHTQRQARERGGGTQRRAVPELAAALAGVVGGQLARADRAGGGASHQRHAVPRLPALEDTAGRGHLVRRSQLQLHALPRLPRPRRRQRSGA